MRVFVTGATGFLGGALARALVNKGADVHVLARSAADRSTLDGVAVTWHKGDVTAPSTLAGLFSGASWVIHAAGRLGEAGVPEEVYHNVNVHGTRNVMAAALEAIEKPRVLHLSSPGVLGPTTREPATEGAPYAPTNPYERSKAAAEQVAREFAALGLPVVIARPGFIYGPGDRHVLKLFRAIHRGRFFYVDGGMDLCHPTFIADAVNGMLLCLRQGRTGEAYHICGPHPVTFRELGEAIANALGVRPPWLSMPRWLTMIAAAGLEALGRLTRRTPPLSRTGVAFFSEDRVFSCRKAYDQLGYAAQWDLTTGVTQTVAWYRQRGWL